MSDALNILHLSTPFSWRGGEQQIAYLIEALTTEAGVRQKLICPKGSKMQTYCQQKTLPHFAISKISPFNPLFAYQIREQCVQHSVDILHLHDAHALNFGVLAAVLFQNKTPMVLSRKVDFPINNRWWTHFKYQHPQLKHIVCVSNAIQNIIKENLKRPPKCSTVYDGIDLNRFRRNKFTKNNFNKLKKEFNINESTFLVGNVAALSTHKDYFTFLDTAKLLITKYNLDIHFFIIGEGAEYEAINRHRYRLGIQNHVTLTGFRKDIEDILPELDVFLMTSQTEGLGSSLLDAMASKVPIVATRTGGIPEVIKDGQTGFLAATKDAEQLAIHVHNFLTNKDLRQKIIDNSTLYVQNFSAQNMATKTLKIYREVLENG